VDLNQVTLPSTNVERAIRFYMSLGLVLVVENLPEYARFEFPFGNSTLSLHYVEQIRQPTGVVVYFECEDLDARVAALMQQGVAFDTGPSDQTWLWREAHLRDPDGNVLCLYRAGVNRRNPPWRVNSR
jgi:predicted enzyme related to lactoylglutathione lyase